MSALLSVLVAAVAGAGEGCYVPAEQTAGWKRVDLPEDAPALAAPADLDQFRSGEPAWLVEQDPRAYQGATDQGRGRMDYLFRVPPGARRLVVAFVAPLRGAKVDAFAAGGGRTFPLWDERRVAETEVALEWDLPEVEDVVIRVHHHLRPVPVVGRWRTARWVDLAADTSVPAAFRVTRSLYFRHPGGRAVELCELPAQPPSVDRARLQGTPATATLRRRP